VIVICFALSALASIAATFVYVFGGQPQLEGALLGVALGGIGVGLVLIAREFLPHGPFVQERSVIPAQPQEEEEAEESFAEGAEALGRRRFISKLVAVAFGTLGIAALFPIRSLGIEPGRRLFHTHWAEGLRVVTKDDEPIRPDELPIHGFITIFPEGHTEAADAQAVLIRMAESDEVPRAADAAYGTLVAFSKVCTHAGCPVGLYQAETRELFCPCHQSVFNVLKGAQPTAGPATRALPQLPLGIDDDGYLIALGDFPEPVGPGFWNRGRA
jgi:ubiquinol-cytochrome c reductase iron-sulfur subunit